MEPDPVQSLLPWGHPFRMIDRLIECVPHERILTLKLVTVNDVALAGVPGIARTEHCLSDSAATSGMGEAGVGEAGTIKQDDAGRVTPHPSAGIHRQPNASARDSGSVDGNSGGALPSAMVLEGIGQSASLLYQLSYGRVLGAEVPLLGFLKAACGSQARSGDSIIFTVRAVKMTPTMGLFEGTAEVDGARIARAEFALGISRPDQGEEPPPAEPLT